MINTLSIQAGQTIDANPHRINFATIASEYNSHDKNIYNVHGLDKNNKITTVGVYTDLLNNNKPIGTVIPIWDNDIEAVQEVLDTDMWTIMDGSTISDADSPFNEIELPDLSEAYLSCSETNINKTHIGEPYNSRPHPHSFNHNHSGTHTHSANAGTHTHVYNSQGYYIGYNSSNNTIIGYKTITFSTSWTTTNSHVNSPTIITSSYTMNRRAGSSTTVPQTSGAASNPFYTSFNTISTNLTINNFNSEDYDLIKPRSIKCRYYLRYK